MFSKSRFTTIRHICLFLIPISLIKFGSLYGSPIDNSVPSEDPFTVHYYRFINKFPPLKVYTYPGIYPRFDFVVSREWFEPKFSKHTYMHEFAFFNHLQSSKFSVPDPEKADLFIPNTTFSPLSFKNGNYSEIIYNMMYYGPYYERYGGVDHIILMALYPSYIGPIDISDTIIMPHSFTNQNAPWNYTLEKPRESSKISIVPVLSDVKTPFVIGPRPISVFMLASKKTREPETDVIRIRLFEELDKINNTKLLTANRFPENPKQNIAPIINMRKSYFCATPLGDCPTSKRFYDALHSGCIPVIYSDYVRYPFEGLFLNYSRFLVQQRMTDYDNIKKNFNSLNTKKIEALQKTILKMHNIFSCELHEELTSGRLSWAWLWQEYFKACNIASAKRRRLLENKYLDKEPWVRNPLATKETCCSLIPRPRPQPPKAPAPK